MTGAQIRVCPDCLGARRVTVTDPDADGGKSVVCCEGCDGEGRVVVCFEDLCGEVFPLAEASKEGAFCAACRAVLDVSDQEAERARLRNAS